MYLKDVINRIDPADIKQISQIDIYNWYSALYVKLQNRTKMKNKEAVKEITHILRHMGYEALCEIPVEKYSICKIYDKHDELELAKMVIILQNDDRLYKYSLKGTVEYVAGPENIK